MPFICRVKQLLKIVSPSGGYKYCKINGNINNKRKCLKCKHFKTSLYYKEQIGERIKSAMERGIKSVK